MTMETWCPAHKACQAADGQQVTTATTTAAGKQQHRLDTTESHTHPKLHISQFVLLLLATSGCCWPRRLCQCEACVPCRHTCRAELDHVAQNDHAAQRCTLSCDGIQALSRAAPAVGNHKVGKRQHTARAYVDDLICKIEVDERSCWDAWSTTHCHIAAAGHTALVGGL